MVMAIMLLITVIPAIIPASYTNNNTNNTSNNTPCNNNSSSLITAAEAQSIALAQAGLSSPAMLLVFGQSWTVMTVGRSMR